MTPEEMTARIAELEESVRMWKHIAQAWEKRATKLHARLLQVWAELPTPKEKEENMPFDN
jgi:maltooligosyltrehalose synthase